MSGDSDVRPFGLAEFFSGNPIFTGSAPRENGQARTVGQSSVIELAGNPIEFDLRKSHSETFHIDFIFIRAGRYSYRADNRWVPAEARLVIAPNGIASEIRLEGQWEILVIRLPREAAESFTPHPPREVIAFEEVSTLERSMYAFASSLISSQDPLSAVEIYALEQLLLEMAGASMLHRLGKGWALGAPHAVLLDQAIAVIAQQCADPQLTPAIVAHEVRSSLRQLQTVFGNAGTSLSAEIRTRRAYNARALLRDARYDVLTIDQIAERSGFRTTMSMRRALVDIYGFGPREIRRNRE